MLRLVSRLIGRHNLLILQFYPYVLRYLTSHDKDKIGEVFAMIIEACHDLVPPEDIKPLIDRIIQNYVTDYCANQHITIGINAIREILQRMPLALDQAQVEYLVDFRQNKNKSVMSAAKSLVNYFRDVCPHMLPKKYIGRFTDLDAPKEMPIYGERKINKTIEGIEYLKEGKNVLTERLLTDRDLKKIRVMKLREAVKKVDRKGFRSSSEDEDSEEAEFAMEEGEAGESEIEEDVSETELAKVAALKQYKDMHSSQEEGSGEDEGDEEMGEDDMDEMDFDEEGEEESYYENEEGAESDQEGIPALVPIISKPKKSVSFHQELPEVSEKSKEVSSESDSFDSEEEEESDTERAHGFVYSHHLDTYKKSKKEKNVDHIAEREQTKEERRLQHKKRDRKTAHGSTTNATKTKNKSFNMLLPKRVKEIYQKESDVRGMLKRRDRNAIGQLGHFHNSTKQGIQSKKRRLQF